MIYKRGVPAEKIDPIIHLALLRVDAIYDSYGETLVVTSTTDGKHSKNSLHYCGLAADIRTRYFEDDAVIRNVFNDVKTELQRMHQNFDVVLEDDHIHIEYDRRKL